MIETAGKTDEQFGNGGRSGSGGGDREEVSTLVGQTNMQRGRGGTNGAGEKRQHQSEGAIGGAQRKEDRKKY